MSVNVYDHKKSANPYKVVKLRSLILRCGVFMTTICLALNFKGQGKETSPNLPKLTLSIRLKSTLGKPSGFTKIMEQHPLRFFIDNRGRHLKVLRFLNGHVVKSRLGIMSIELPKAQDSLRRVLI
jgi:hypothetical protein